MPWAGGLVAPVTAAAMLHAVAVVKSSAARSSADGVGASIPFSHGSRGIRVYRFPVESGRRPSLNSGHAKLPLDDLPRGVAVSLFGSGSRVGAAGTSHGRRDRRPV